MATREQTSVEKIDKLISEVRSSVVSFHDKTQEAAVAIISHAQAYGDCSRAKMLGRAVPSRLRNMLIGYFALYSPIGITIGMTAADDKSKFIASTSMKYHDFNLDGARLNKWYDDPAKAAPEPKPLDTLNEAWSKVDTFFKRLLDDARKDDEKAKYREEDRPVIAAMAIELQTLVNRYHAKQLQARAAMEEHETEEEEGTSGETNTNTNVVQAPKPTQRQARQTKKNVKAASVH